jgi:tRNA threonylcarbamoyladenosine biosynthesis protein TsaE
MNTRVFKVASIHELEDACNFLRSLLATRPVVCFYGEMGAGKTTFIQFLLAKMGAGDQVSSPTFSIVNEYQLPDKSAVFHFDFYRLSSLQEALDIGCEEYLESGSVCLIEWPGLIEPLLPQNHVHVSISESIGQRLIEIR